MVPYIRMQIIFERAHSTHCRYYDIVEGKGALAREGERVVVHYEARWRGVTFMTSRWADPWVCQQGGRRQQNSSTFTVL